MTGCADTFVVIRSRGPAWRPGVPMREQPAWDAHAVFMNGLASDGVVVRGGPLGEGERALLIVEAASEAAVRQRLQSDPWTGMKLLRIDSITPWHILLSRADGRRQRTQ